MVVLLLGAEFVSLYRGLVDLVTVGFLFSVRTIRKQLSFEMVRFTLFLPVHISWYDSISYQKSNVFNPYVHKEGGGVPDGF